MPLQQRGIKRNKTQVMRSHLNQLNFVNEDGKSESNLSHNFGSKRGLNEQLQPAAYEEHRYVPMSTAAPSEPYHYNPSILEKHSKSTRGHQVKPREQFSGPQNIASDRTGRTYNEETSKTGHGDCGDTDEGQPRESSQSLEKHENYNRNAVGQTKRHQKDGKAVQSIVEDIQKKM